MENSLVWETTVRSFNETLTIEYANSKWYLLSNDQLNSPCNLAILPDNAKVGTI